MENALTMKVLGLPAWAWGAILGVGIAGVAYLHRSKQAAADANSADPNPALDANGNPLSSDGLAGAQDSGGADQQYLGTAPLTDYSGSGGGFNYSPPPPPPPADLRLPASTIAELNRLAKEEAVVKRQQAILNRQRGHRNPPPKRRAPAKGRPQKGAGLGTVAR